MCTGTSDRAIVGSARVHVNAVKQCLSSKQKHDFVISVCTDLLAVRPHSITSQSALFLLCYVAGIDNHKYGFLSLYSV